MGPTRATVIYDADCGFCKWSLALLLSIDRRRALRPLPLGTPEADRLLADLSVEERNASWHLIMGPAASPVRGDATPTAPRRFSAGDPFPASIAPRRSSAGAAFAPALSLLRGGRIPAVAFARFPRPTERSYRWVVRHRGRLGRFVPARARRWAERVIAAHDVGTRPQ
jgi:predicted DCC family thiol-disulfide oxidoreductase YuxK